MTEKIPADVLFSVPSIMRHLYTHSEIDTFFSVYAPSAIINEQGNKEIRIRAYFESVNEYCEDSLAILGKFLKKGLRGE